MAGGRGVVIAPGIYRNIPYDTYAAWPAVRASTLIACARSMAHGRQAELDGGRDTAALSFGTAFHTALLEPDRFRREFAVAPSVDRRTKDGKQAWADFLAANGGKTPITEDDHAIAEAMIRSVYAHRDAAELLSNALAKEVAFVWRDEATGVLCKGRADAITTFAGWTVILDLKSARDASKRAFARDMSTHGYYRAMAWYRRGLAALAPAERRCVLLPVEKTPPYCTATYEIDCRALDKGDEEMTDLLTRYDEARRSNVWPGYPHDTAVIDLPEWVYRQEAA